jgi:hypothetical protein
MREQLETMHISLPGVLPQGWRMAFLYNLLMLVIIPMGGSVLPA